MKNESKDEIFLKLIKSRKFNIEDIISFVKANILNFDKLDNTGYNLLHHSIKAEKPEVVSVLLKPDYHPEGHTANPNLLTSDIKDNVFLPPMLLALNTNNDSSSAYRIIKLLHKAGGDYSIKDEEDCNIYHRACEKGRIDILEYLISLDNSLNINDLCKHGSGLHLALIGEQEEVISFLLDKDIDIMLRDNNKNTSLHLAIQLKMFNPFKYICDFILKNSNISNEVKKNIFNSVNQEGNSILHELAYAKSSVLIDFLLKMNEEYRVDDQIKNSQGYTYKGVQDNIIKLQKERIELEKLKKEQIRKEKERLIEEQRKELETEMEYKRLEAIKEEKRRKIGMMLLKYKGYIFLLIFFIFMFILFFALSAAAKKKKEIII
jgi:ankyrin repeat protein